MNKGNWLFVKPKQREGLCLWCGRIVDLDKRSGKPRKYCSQKCNTKYNSMKGKQP